MIDALVNNKIEYRQNEPLCRHSSFKIGGCADIAVFPKTEDELVLALEACVSSGIKYTVIGNGTNVLFADNGYRGAVIFTKRMLGVSVEEGDGMACFTAYAGASLASVANSAAELGYEGLEFLHGIPASVGGAVAMNAGAFGSEVSDVLVSARVFDIKNNLFNDLLPNELGLSYRHSLLMNDKTLLCTKAKLLAKKGNREEIKAKMEEFKQKRLSSQPYTSASAGSYFKRPEGYYAAKLIDDCGLKGLSSGAAAVSEKHAGFIINLGGATAADVLALADKVKDSVYKKYGVMLEPEVRYIEE